MNPRNLKYQPVIGVTQFLFSISLPQLFFIFIVRQHEKVA
jgi:hypothetical protein